MLRNHQKIYVYILRCMGYNDGMDEYINIDGFYYKVLSVEDVEHDGKEQIKFVYQHRKTGEKEEILYAIRTDKDNPKNKYIERKVIRFSKKQKIRCDLIETKEQLDECIKNSGGEKINFDNCIFSSDIDFNWREFEKNVNFENAIFRGKSHFSGAIFGGVANFNKASFGEEANFSEASFGGIVSFEGASFGGEVSFGGKANFSDANFGGEVFFWEASFNGVVYFSGASFNGADFSGASFGGNTYFSKASFGEREVYFREVSFGGRVSFEGAIFGGRVSFEGAIFGGVADFIGASFGGEIYFDRASFGEEANFSKANFGREVFFRGAMFAKESHFFLATFNKYSDFHQAKFGDKAHFSHVTFEEETRFREVRFIKKADFRHAVFKKEADFIKAIFEERASFLVARIDLFIFRAVNEKVPQAEFKLDLTYARIEDMDYKKSTLDTKYLKNRETCVILKKSAAKQHDQVAALNFYKSEMHKYYNELWGKGEHKQSDEQADKQPDKNTERNNGKRKNRVIDKWIVWFEKHVSDFGTNPIQAAGWLLGANFLLACIHILIGHQFSQFLSVFYFPSLYEYFVLVKQLGIEIGNLLFFYFRHSEIDNIYFTHYLAFIINAVLVYEIVKSARKFSRRFN